MTERIVETAALLGRREKSEDLTLLCEQAAAELMRSSGKG